jgi:hypothetical protein
MTFFMRLDHGIVCCILVPRQLIHKIIWHGLIIFCLMTSPNYSFTQPFFKPKVYTADTYAPPIELPMMLNGNFGECRKGHFHAGIDLSTKGKEDLPVSAIENGFVYRVKIEPEGYGQSVYIIQPDGQMAVYAHLNRFFSALQKFVVDKQYKTESWKQDMYFSPHQFPVSKGQLIAYSGNTGYSEGPHLHLEIRNAKTGSPLNPEFYYSNIADTIAPVLTHLAMYNGYQSIYAQTPKVVSLTKSDKYYNPEIDTLVATSDKIYFGISGDDMGGESKAKLGIFEMRLFIDDQPYFAWQMDSINDDLTRYVYAHTYQQKNNKLIQLCHQLPGNKLGIYNSATINQGIVDLSHGRAVSVRIEAADMNGNMGTLLFWVKGAGKSMQQTCDFTLLPNQENSYKDEFIEVNMGDECVYDTVCFSAQATASQQPYSYRYEIGHPAIPIHRFFELKLKPKTTIPLELKNNVALVFYPTEKGQKRVGKAALLLDQKVSTSIREFGAYEIVIDQQPPRITSAIKDNDNISKLQRLTFAITEETTSVKKFVAEVNGRWLMLKKKGDNYYYDIDEYFPKGTHTLKISATDENNNTSERIFKLTR